MGSFLREQPYSCWMAAIATTLLAGCGGGPPPAPPLPDLMPASGTVTMGDEPLDDAVVTFRPDGQGEGYTAQGRTDAEGHYELSTRYDGKLNAGVPAGKYKVYMSRLVAPDGTAIIPDPDTPPANLGARESVPLPYSIPDQSPLKADVPQGGGDSFDFQLKARK